MPRAARLATTMLISGGALIALPASPASAQVDYDCPDFPSQDVAQVVFVEAGGLRGNDRFRLDRDDDLIACEDQFGGGDRDIEGLPPAEDLGLPIDGGNGGTEQPPVGGVDTGAGGTATQSAAGPVLVTGSTVAGLGLIAFVYSRRRRLSE